jgi:hypothetical protein
MENAPGSDSPRNVATKSRRRRWPYVLLGFILVVAVAAGLFALASRLPVVTSTTATQPNSGAGVYSLAGGGACVRLGDKPSPPYANIRTTHDTSQAHSETSVAVDPKNPLHLVGGAKYFPDRSRYVFQVGYVSSTDGGCTWQDGGALPGFPRSYITSDPVFAFGDGGRAYAAAIYTDNDKDSGIAVWSSADGGKTFGQPTRVFDDPTGAVFSDKGWIAVDHRNTPQRGNIYAVWSYDHLGGCNEDGTCGQQVAFSRSTDGGKSFSPPQLIEGQAPFCTDHYPRRPIGSLDCDLGLGATPTVLSDGTIAVAFSYLAPDGHSEPTRMLVVTSTDGGNSWTPPVLVATVHDIFGVFPHERYRVVSLPAFAADPQSNRLYLAWADESTGDSDILLSTSTDRGKSWSRPVRVNDDPLRNGAQQFFPQLAVAPNGVVSVSFFDTRLDPVHHLIDAYLTQSLDMGATFLPNVRVTTSGFDPSIAAPRDESGAAFIGDYHGLAADNHFVHLFWNDTRTGAQEVFTAAVPSAQP